MEIIHTSVGVSFTTLHAYNNFQTGCLYFPSVSTIFLLLGLLSCFLAETNEDHMCGEISKITIVDKTLLGEIQVETISK